MVWRCNKNDQLNGSTGSWFDTKRMNEVANHITGLQIVKNLWKPVKHETFMKSLKNFEESESLDSNISD